MPGILPMKVIQVGTSAQARIAQACDRCRSKKIRCDGIRPYCSQCANVGFECKTSDKLSRRAFPRGYTESLEERVRVLETEVRELKDLLDSKDDKIDLLSKIHPSRHDSSSLEQKPSVRSTAGAPTSSEAESYDANTKFTVQQGSVLHPSRSSHDPCFSGSSGNGTLFDTLMHRTQKRDIHGKDVDITQFHCAALTRRSIRSIAQSDLKAPPRLSTDHLVNVFFQEWAPLFPVLHRPTFLALYETYLARPNSISCNLSFVQLNLVFGIAAVSNKTRIHYDTSVIDGHWLNVLDEFAKEATLQNLQCLVMAQLYCFQLGNKLRLLHYKSLAVTVVARLGLDQSQKKFKLDTLLRETRKKVFWTQYVLDCFSAAVSGLPALLNEDDIYTEYPIDVDDEYISEQGLQPVLPGESTKLSSALALLRGCRLLAKVLRQLYISTPTYELSMVTVTTLSEELDDWSINLLPHLKMGFTHEKPSTHVTSSRSPLLALTYHYIRTLIHRLPACASGADHASASLLSLASSSKHIVQILQLLDERKMSFTFCLSKTELLLSCGFGLLLQTLDLPRSSKLLKDSQRTICAITSMLEREGASGATTFKRLSHTLLRIGPETATSSGQRSVGPTAPFSQSGRSVSHSDSQFLPHTRDRGTETGHASTGEISAASMAVGSVCPESAKCYRTTVPSALRRSSTETSLKPIRGPSIIYEEKSPRQGSMTTSSWPNLDYCSFSTSATPAEHDHFHEKEQQDQNQLESVNWEKLLSTLNKEEAAPGCAENDWPSINELLSPLQDETSLETEPCTDRFPSNDWSLTSPPSTSKTPHSLLSYSEDSFTAGEEFSSVEWGTSDTDSTFRAIVMPTTTYADDGSRPRVDQG